MEEPRTTGRYPADGPISALLPAAGIRVGARASDWREAVALAGAALVAAGATADGYTAEMIRTVEELGPYIVIAPGVALAHARPSPAVRRAGLSLVTLADPVPFGHPDNDPVRLVIGLAAPNDRAHVAALAALAEFLADDDRRRALLEAREVAAIQGLIAAYEATMAGPSQETSGDGEGAPDEPGAAVAVEAFPARPDGGEEKGGSKGR
jgi:PTS system ascorbate-specific IIA component